MNRAWTIVGTAIIALSSLYACGCTAVEDSTEAEHTRSAASPQMDNGYHDWRRYTFTFENEEPLATMLGFNERVGGFLEDTEYWYIHTDGLQYLGSEDLVISYVDGDGTPSTPSGDQTFTQPTYPTWNAFSSDPVSGGSLYGSGNIYLRFDDDSEVLTRITWYQVIPSTASPFNVAPSGTFTFRTGSVSATSGYQGYCIDASLE